MSIKNYELRLSKNAYEQSEAFYCYLKSVIEERSKCRQTVIIGFSGGSMPAFLAQQLVRLSDQTIAGLRLFPVDERLVSVDSEESNAGTLLRLLPDKFREKRFEQQLRVLSPQLDANGWPVFDLLLLGLGPDGHTCSLFPGHPLLKEESVWIAPIDDSPKPPPRRITVTIPLLNAAANLAFIANGASKAAVLKKIVVDNDKTYPPCLIRPNRPIQWFLDDEAVKEMAAVMNVA
ncbi:hypothetical protein niasHS_003858 [Heterodera schachtii]|uniref:Glucosamine/galactosamine-6-phosphate isomerase domain-containing protein n=1 Tax=Heterodera schachtii TaxID=97005 RepID=A0ABD2K3E5_HETSC